MTMQSSNLLPALQELPGDNSGRHRTFRDHITGLVNMDRAMYAAEFASAASFGLWAVFDSNNVDDNLTAAYEAQYPGLAADQSLHDQWQEMIDRGPDAMDGFISGLKGKVAEFNAVETLEQNGFTEVTVAAGPTQPLWDISAVNEAGDTIFFQVKTGVEGYANQVQDLMVENSDIHYAVSTEIYNDLTASALNTLDRMHDMGPNMPNEQIREILNTMVADPNSVSDGAQEMMNEAYKRGFKDVLDTYSLTDRWQQMGERGLSSETSFINNMKGPIGEYRAKEYLEQQGFTDVELAPLSNQEHWDISAIGPDGQEQLFQAKFGGETYIDQVHSDMTHAPESVDFVLSSEIYNGIADPVQETVDRLTDIGADYLLVEGITDGLNTLSGNMGIDIPDGVGEIIPYAGPIIAGARLIHSVIKTETEFKATDRTTRNKIQVVQTLTLMSRMGITTVLATAGGMGGGAIGSAVPGVGNLVGGIVGAVGGAGIGMYLNRHLQPHMLNLALDITGLTNDDLFYYKNKPRIDEVAVSFQSTARELAAAPV